MNNSTWYQLRLHSITASLVIIFSTIHAGAQDTVRITVQDAEKAFLQNNLSLLAAKYNIDVNRALVHQAKLWDNPVLSTDQNIYDAQGGFFKHSDNGGQIYVQAMQLVRTAGKRNKLAQLAEDNTTLSTEQFDDLLRTLRYTLVSDLHETEHQLKIKHVYDAEIAELQKLSDAMDIQLKTGNISVKDNMRVKALLFSLQNELVNVQAQVMPLQSEIKLLLGRKDSTFISPSFSYYLPDVINAELPDKQQLLQQAIQNRPDAKMARTQLDYQNHNLIYQKALAKPDISVGTEFDQRSSYAPNYVGLAISFPLNILNKNQGNISSAQYGIKQQQALLDVQLLKVESDVMSSIARVKYYQQVNNIQQLDFSQQYDTLFQNMLESYEQRQVSLLELIDFADAYKDTKLKILDQHTALIRSITELNYNVGTDVINISK